MKFGWNKLILVVILFFAYATRLWNLSTPSEFYFDEVYHAFTAQAYATNDPRGYEWWHQAPEGVAYEWLHPPIAKLFQGLSIYLLGNTSFAWRLPSAIFGTLTVWAIYYLAYQITQNKSLGLLAAFIASLDGLLLAQSRIAMNDIFVTFFIVLAFACHWRYLQEKKPPSKKIWMLFSGVMAGLAMATKWSGVFVLGIFWLGELINLARDPHLSKIKRLVGVVMVFEIIPATMLALLLKHWVEMTKGNEPLIASILAFLLILEIALAFWTTGLKKTLLIAFSFVFIPISIYVLSYGQFWLQTRDNNLLTFRDLHHQIWWYQTHLEATHPWQSRPHEWFLDLKPVWYYVTYQGDQVGNIFALANPAIAWSGIGALILVVFWGIKEKKWSYLYLVAAYFSVWAPWLASPRIMFYYHYAPGLALLVVVLAIALYRLWQIKYLKWLSAGVLSSIIVLFIFFYPHWTGLLVPKSWAEYYYWFASWRP